MEFLFPILKWKLNLELKFFRLSAIKIGLNKTQLKIKIFSNKKAHVNNENIKKKNRLGLWSGMFHFIFVIISNNK